MIDRLVFSFRRVSTCALQLMTHSSCAFMAGGGGGLFRDR
eukprot:COSAG01_NODE_39531_length_475_cov_1.159574_2_plen_39_part_01